MEKNIAKYHGAPSTYKDLQRLYWVHPRKGVAALQKRVKCKGPAELYARKLAAWSYHCVRRVVNEALFGRVLDKQQRKALSKVEKKKIKLAIELVSAQLEKVLAGERGKLCAQDVYRLYRRRHPHEYDDAALEEHVTIKATELKAATGEVSLETLNSWCHQWAWVYADEILHGRALTQKQRKALTNDEQEKLRLARAILHEQMVQIIDNYGVSKSKDLQRLYRQLHPREGDVALKERVMCEAAAGFNKKPAEKDTIPGEVDRTMDTDVNDDNSLKKKSTGEKNAVSQQSINNVKAGERSSGDSIDNIDLTPDAMEYNDRTTDGIIDIGDIPIDDAKDSDNLEVDPDDLKVDPYDLEVDPYDLEVDPDDLEDY